MDKTPPGLPALAFILLVAAILTWFAGIRAEAGHTASAEAASLALQAGAWPERAKDALPAVPRN